MYKRDEIKEDELKKQVTTMIEDVFVHTLEVRLDEDVPSLADDIVDLITQKQKEAVDNYTKEKEQL